MVYQPKSSHCIHIDAKAEEKVYAAVKGIVKCYKEVYLQVRHLLFLNESLYKIKKASIAQHPFRKRKQISLEEIFSKQSLLVTVS